MGHDTMKYLALDLGSSFVKAAILDTKKEIIHSRQKIPSLPKLPGEETRYEIDSELLWGQVKKMIDGYIEFQGMPDGILLSTQMHGFVLTDNAGLPVSHYISWQDNRSLENYEGQSWYTHLDRLISREDMANTGLTLKPNLGICKLYPLVQENVIPPGSHLSTLGSYIIRRLTGNNICHITNAAPMGLVDILHKAWDWPLIEKIGCHNIQFPEITAEFSPCGMYSYCGADIPVYPDMGDHQACILGSLVQPGKDVNINIGTAGLIGIVTEGFCPGAYGEIRPLNGNLYIKTVRGLFGGRDMDVLVGFLEDCINRITGIQIHSEEIWKALHTLQSNNYMTESSLCINNGFYTNGTIEKINYTNFSLASLIAELYSSAAKDYASALKRIDPLVKVKHIVFSGGAAQQNFPLMRRISNEIGCTWECSPVSDEAMLGLYRVALVCSGQYKEIQDTRESARVVTIKE